VSARPDASDAAAADLAAHLGESAAAAHPDPLFLCGDAREVLGLFPRASVDCCVTSPPYFGHRRYAGGGIGAEGRWQDYVAALGAVFAEVRHVLRPTGSLWLNLGDTYRGKRQLGIPWRVAFALSDQQGWILRNSVVWHKVKGGPDGSHDRLRNVHELLFHFVRQARGYYYDDDAVRGVRYRRQIELSTALDETEKAAALAALEATLAEVAGGRLADFRLVIRGQQRSTHSDSPAVSGRARELRERGFCVLRYHPGGSKPGDVWDIMPEDTHGREAHYAAFPADLCRIPILATCPRGGVVLDPFCGTGTAMLVARELGRRSVGIDVAGEYLALARERLKR